MKNEYIKLRILKFFLKTLFIIIITLPGYVMYTNYYLTFIIGLGLVNLILYILSPSYMSPLLKICPSLKQLDEYKIVLQKKKKGGLLITTILCVSGLLFYFETSWNTGPLFNFNIKYIFAIIVFVIIMEVLQIYFTENKND